MDSTDSINDLIIKRYSIGTPLDLCCNSCLLGDEKKAFYTLSTFYSWLGNACNASKSSLESRKRFSRLVLDFTSYSLEPARHLTQVDCSGCGVDPLFYTQTELGNILTDSEFSPLS